MYVINCLLIFAGNADTLKHDPKKNNIDTYTRLRDFWQRHYSAHYMTLVVQSKGNISCSLWKGSLLLLGLCSWNHNGLGWRWTSGLSCPAGGIYMQILAWFPNENISICAVLLSFWHFLNNFWLKRMSGFHINPKVKTSKLDLGEKLVGL